MALTVGCSIQKRTHLPGFHVEHRSRQAAKPAAKPVHPAPANHRAPEETMAEALAFTSAKADDVVAFEVVPDRAMAGLNMHEMKSTVATAIARQSFNPSLVRPPGLQTPIPRSFAPEVDLAEARAMAWDESRKGFGLGILFLLSTLVLFPAVLSAFEALTLGGLGTVGFFLRGFYFKRLAKDDARLAAWYEKRMAQLARIKQMSVPPPATWTWWEWLLFVLALLLGLTILGVAFYATMMAMSGL